MSKQLTYRQVTTGISYPVKDLYGYPDSLIKGRTSAAYNYAINLLYARPHLKILDFGSGRGHGIAAIQQQLSPKYLASVDAEKTYVNIAQRPLHHHGNIDFIVADKTSGFQDNSFDAIFCMHVVEHLLNPQPVISDFFRILKKDGVLFIATPDQAHLVGKSAYDRHIFSESELTTMLEQAGFSKSILQYISADKKAWGMHKRKQWLARRHRWSGSVRNKVKPIIWESMVLRLGKSTKPLSSSNFFLSDRYTEHTIDVLVTASKQATGS